MMVALDHSPQWATLLGLLTLTCWLVAGVVAVFGTSQELRHGGIGGTAGYVTTFLTGTGLISALTMIVVMLLT
jgi:hypothetical protein